MTALGAGRLTEQLQSPEEQTALIPLHVWAAAYLWTIAVVEMSYPLLWAVHGSALHFDVPLRLQWALLVSSTKATGAWVRLRSRWARCRVCVGAGSCACLVACFATLPEDDSQDEEEGS